MTALAENTLHPLEIPDAREAAHEASKKQRDVENELRDKSRALADAERKYRRELRKRTLELHVKGDPEMGAGPLAITTCEGIARGEDEVSDLRHTRDIAKGDFESVQQQAFRRGADRKDVNQLLIWSEKRDLRTDAPPENWPRPEGAGVLGGVDPETGELRSAA